MLKNVFSLPKENCFLARGTLPLESSEAPPVVTIEVLHSNKEDHELYLESELQSEVYGKASSVAKVFLEASFYPRFQGKGGKASDASWATDFSSLWPQTAPIPPTGLISSAFSLPPLLWIKTSEEKLTRVIQFIYEYYVPEKNDFLHLSSLVLWKTYVAAFSGIYFSSQKFGFQSTLAYYLSQRSTGVTENANPQDRKPSSNFFRAGLWSEEVLWKLFSSLLSGVALFHSHGYHFSGKISVDNIFCFAVPVHVSDELHHAMSSIVSTVIAERENKSIQKGKEGYEAEFDRILVLYAKATETSIILPSCRILESTPAHQVYFVLTSIPVSVRKAAVPEVEQQYQLQDLQAIRNVMECVLSEQESSVANSLPRSSINEELKILLRCIPSSSPDSPDLLAASALTSPSAVQVLQLQALRLRQAAWLWQSIAELSQWQGCVLRQYLEVTATSTDETHEENSLVKSPSLSAGNEKKLPPEEIPLPPLLATSCTDNKFFQTSPHKQHELKPASDSYQTPRRREHQKIRQEGPPVSTSTYLTHETVCKKCADLDHREKLIEDREEKVASLLELYELTQEQLDRLPNAHHFGYEELRRRLTAHLLRPVQVEPVKIPALNTVVEIDGGYYAVGGNGGSTVLPSCTVPFPVAATNTTPSLFLNSQTPSPSSLPNVDSSTEMRKGAEESLFTSSFSYPHTASYPEHAISNDSSLNGTTWKPNLCPTKPNAHPTPTVSSSPTPHSYQVSLTPFPSPSFPTSVLLLPGRETTEEKLELKAGRATRQVSPRAFSSSVLPPSSVVAADRESAPHQKESPSSTPSLSRRSATRHTTPVLSTSTPVHPTTPPTSTKHDTSARKSPTTPPRPLLVTHTASSSRSMKSVLRYEPKTSNVPLTVPQRTSSNGQKRNTKKRLDKVEVSAPPRVKDKTAAGTWLEERISTLAALRESFEQSRPHLHRSSPSLRSEKKTTPSGRSPIAETEGRRRGTNKCNESTGNGKMEKQRNMDKRSTSPSTKSSSHRRGIPEKEGEGEAYSANLTVHTLTLVELHPSSSSSSHVHRRAGTEPRSSLLSSSWGSAGSSIQMEVEVVTPRTEEGGEKQAFYRSVTSEAENSRGSTEVDSPAQAGWMCEDEVKDEKEGDRDGLAGHLKRSGTPPVHSAWTRATPPYDSLSETGNRLPKDSTEPYTTKEPPPLPSASSVDTSRKHLLSDYAAQSLLRKLRSH